MSANRAKINLICQFATAKFQTKSEDKTQNLQPKFNQIQLFTRLKVRHFYIRFAPNFNQNIFSGI